MSSRASSRARTTRLLAPPREGRGGAWLYALRTTNPPPGRDPRTLDVVTKWIVATRAGRVEAVWAVDARGALF